MAKKKIDLSFTEREIVKPFKISNSRIALFKTCPLQFYFRYLTSLGDMQTTWPGTLFGLANHEIFEDVIASWNNGESHTDIVKRVKAGLFVEKFWKLREEKKSSWKESRSYDEESYLKEGVKYSTILTKFFLKFIPPHVELIKSEFEISHPFDGVEDIILNGIVDCAMMHKVEINENGDDIIPYDILDLKTTTDSEKYYFVDWEFETQNTIYEYLCKKEFGRFCDSFSFVVLNREERTLFLKQRLTPAYENEEQFYERLGLLRERIIEVRDFTFQKNKPLLALRRGSVHYERCKWCPYKKHCETIG